MKKSSECEGCPLLTTIQEEYVTLFCEGDGHVRVSDFGVPIVVFSQKERSVLDYINSLFGGGLLRWDTSGIWILRFNGSHCMPLLEAFSRRVVGRQFLDRLNGVLLFRGMSLAIQHPLTVDGFVGFWDAEGHSSNSPSIGVCQKNREILDQVVELFGGNVRLGRDNVHYWSLHGRKADNLCEILVAKSHKPEKAEMLRKHFNEERGKQQKEYWETYKKERQAYNKSYYELHKEEITSRQRTLRKEQKSLREWMRAHPEEVDKLKERL